MVASSPSDIRAQALACRTAAQQLAQLSSGAKTALLDAMAAALETDAALHMYALPQHWPQWRSLAAQADVLIDRLELIHDVDARDVSLAERVRADILQISPHTEVRLHAMPLQNPWDFEEVYAALHDFTTDLPHLLHMSRQLPALLGHELPGQVAKAGRNGDLHPPPDYIATL